MVNLERISILNDSANSEIFYIYLNPTFTATGSFIQTSSNSVVSYATGGTIASVGNQLLTVYVGPGNTQNLDLKALSLILTPGDILAVGGVGIGGVSNCWVTLSWTELF